MQLTCAYLQPVSISLCPGELTIQVLCQGQVQPPHATPNFSAIPKSALAHPQGRPEPLSAPTHALATVEERGI